MNATERLLDALEESGSDAPPWGPPARPFYAFRYSKQDRPPHTSVLVVAIDAEQVRMGATSEVVPMSGRVALLRPLRPGCTTHFKVNVESTPPTGFARRYVALKKDKEYEEVWLGTDQNGELVEAVGYEPGGTLA